jgi:hypothetical protein
MRFVELLIVAGLLCACDQSIVTTDFSAPQAAPQAVATVQDCRQPGDLLEVFSIQAKQITWRAGKFSVVFTLENMSTSPAYLFMGSSGGVSEIYLLNQQGVKYSYDLRSPEQMQHNMQLYQQLNPGMTMDMKLDFSAPKEEYTFNLESINISNMVKTTFVCRLTR